MTQPNHISRTAYSMALFRALENAKGCNRQQFRDPFAALFLPKPLMYAVRVSHFGLMGGLLERFIDWRWPGARSSGVSRTRLIDDWLIAAIASGAEQVVILGAGFDCRAHRLAQMSSVNVIELDRDVILNKKKKTLSTSAPSVTDNVTYAPIDFLHDDINTVLVRAGFCGSAKTVFVWEGVTHYLQCDAVCSVVNMIANISAPGSSIIFTYIHKDVLDNQFNTIGLNRLLRQLSRWGEPWTLGFIPERLPTYLSERGFKLTADEGAADYRKRYFGDRSQKFKGYEFYRVACAHLVGTANKTKGTQNATR